MNKENLNTETELNDEFNSENMAEECVDNVQNDAENADLTEEKSQENSLEEKYNELNNAHLRLLADFDNFRKLIYFLWLMILNVRSTASKQQKTLMP